MKPARILVVSLGVLAVGLLIVGVLALNSSVQTWAARRALAERPELNATLGSISVGFQRVEIRALQAESNGAVLTLPSLDAVLPVIAAGLQDRVEIKSLVAKGWFPRRTRRKLRPRPNLCFEVYLRACNCRWISRWREPTSKVKSCCPM